MKFLFLAILFLGTIFSKEITFMDEYDNNITLKNPAQKVAMFIIPLASFSIAVDENEKRLASINPTALQAINDGILGKIFPNAKNLSTAGIGADFVPNVEELIKINPDFIVQWGNYGSKLTEPLKKLGIATAFIKFKGEENTIKWFEILAKAYDKEEKINQILEHRQKIRTMLENKNYENTPKVLLLSSTANSYKAAGVDTYHDWALNLIKVKNLAKFSGFKEIETENLIALNPDVIFIAALDKANPKDFYENKSLASIKAVKNRKIYKMPLGGFRWDPPSGESPLSWLWQASLAHDVGFNLKNEMIELYKLLYNYELNDEEIQKILRFSENSNSFKYTESFK